MINIEEDPSDWRNILCNCVPVRTVFLPVGTFDWKNVQGSVSMEPSNGKTLKAKGFIGSRKEGQASGSQQVSGNRGTISFPVKNDLLCTLCRGAKKCLWTEIKTKDRKNRGMRNESKIRSGFKYGSTPSCCVSTYSSVNQGRIIGSDLALFEYVVVWIAIGPTDSCV